MTEYEIVSEALDRLGDQENAIWSRDEMKLYAQDGYDTFCRRSKVLFDILAIENIPPSGNWQSDLELYFLQQLPGAGWTDGPLFRTDSDGTPERNLGGGFAGPQAVGATSPAAALQGLEAGAEIPTTVLGGYLPQTTVEVLRVAFDERDLVPMGSQQLRRIDPTYETRAGDPQYFTYDKDGMFFLRVVPAAGGDATYLTFSGSWGTLTQTDEAGVTVVTSEVTGKQTNGFGILRARSDWFASGGSRGTPTRVHPTDMNIGVEVSRLGRPLSSHRSELPSAYNKYVIYWAMARALRRDGPGQDMALADHYEQRFEMGVSRITKKRNRMSPERVGMLGGGKAAEPFGLGLPNLPSAYESPWSK